MYLYKHYNDGGSDGCATIVKVCFKNVYLHTLPKPIEPDAGLRGRAPTYARGDRHHEALTAGQKERKQRAADFCRKRAGGAPAPWELLALLSTVAPPPDLRACPDGSGGSLKFQSTLQRSA